MSVWLNCGSCDLPLPKPWINIDKSDSPHIRADLRLDCLELDKHFAKGSVGQIYAGHFLEHLYPLEAENWVKMCVELLEPGGTLGIVTPDVDYILSEYVKGNPEFSLEELTQTYILSYKQESYHKSLWTLPALTDLLNRHGLVEVTEINRLDDPRIPFGVPWQCGVQGIKP